jgi:hypothetical protein
MRATRMPRRRSRTHLPPFTSRSTLHKRIHAGGDSRRPAPSRCDSQGPLFLHVAAYTHRKTLGRRRDAGSTRIWAALCAMHRNSLLSGGAGRW